MADGSSGLEVPKTPVRVELALAGAEPRQVELQLAEHQGDFARRQHVIELLASDDGGFLPVGDGAAAGRWSLVNRDAIAWVAVPLTGGRLPVEDSDATTDEALFDVCAVVSVELVGGRTLDGDLLYSPADGRGRVIDHLNDVGRFVSLWTPTAVFLINLRHVTRISER